MKPAAAAASSPIPPSRRKRRTALSSSVATAPLAPADSFAGRVSLPFRGHSLLSLLELAVLFRQTASTENPPAPSQLAQHHRIQSTDPPGLRWRNARHLAALFISPRRAHRDRRDFSLCLVHYRNASR